MMASCSVWRPRYPDIFSSQELRTLLTFQRVGGGWVREVHRHTSRTKQGQSYVIFRNNNNEKVSSLQELRRILEEEGTSSDFLSEVRWRSDRDPDIASNKVGAAKIARQEARLWVEEVMELQRTKAGGRGEERGESQTN